VVGNPALVQALGKRLPKWNLNSLAEAVVYMLKEHLSSYRASLRLLARDRDHMTAELRRIQGLIAYPSQANFVLVKLPPGTDGPQLRDHLLSQHGVLVRECGNKLGITSQFVRLVVRPNADVQRLLDGLADYLDVPASMNRIWESTRGARAIPQISPDDPLGMGSGSRGDAWTRDTGGYLLDAVAERGTRR
jgi:histidinol-phosphate/aromatic aminotransferase/cobyric acid decarboxylase-like protein